MIFIMRKKISFAENPNVYVTYSRDEYDRSCIDSLLYRKCFNRVSHYEWLFALRELDYYKTSIMIVHKASLRNTYTTVKPKATS
jgi:hypothetical protein